MTENQIVTRDCIDSLEKNVNELKKMVVENRAILVGRDGGLGIVGSVALLDTKLDSIKTLITNDLSHMTAKMDIMFNSRDNYEQMKDDLRKEIYLVENKDTVTWGSVLNQWLKPVITALLTGLLTYLIMK